MGRPSSAQGATVDDFLAQVELTEDEWGRVYGSLLDDMVEDGELSEDDRQTLAASRPPRRD